jgi:prepilin-type N-terminal cleavage/methylation domain-containing protein/prepilin-type processing-associated H-X9-DG protein
MAAAECGGDFTNFGRAVRKKGFTLIELLVVIAVIAILAAMLLPALARSKAQAQSTVCKNHLHQMGIALRMYVEDYKAYPYYYGSTANGWEGGYDWPLGGVWHDALEPYYPLAWTNAAYHCPSYNGGLSDQVQGFWSYSYNAFGAQVWPDWTNYNLGAGVYAPYTAFEAPCTPPHSDAQVIAPAEAFAVMDTQLVIPYNQWFASGTVFNFSLGTGWSGFDKIGCFWPGFAPGSPLQHGKVFNVLFCDGHVATVRVTNLFNPTNTARNWNFDHQPHPEAWSDQ